MSVTRFGCTSRPTRPVDLHVSPHPIMNVKSFGPLSNRISLNRSELEGFALQGTEKLNLCETACAFVPWKENELTWPFAAR